MRTTCRRTAALRAHLLSVASGARALILMLTIVRSHMYNMYARLASTSGIFRSLFSPRIVVLPSFSRSNSRKERTHLSWKSLCFWPQLVSPATLRSYPGVYIPSNPPACSTVTVSSFFLFSFPCSKYRVWVSSSSL